MKAITAIVLACLSAGTLSASPLEAPESIAIPGGEPGVGYDDLQYAPQAKRILVPAGRTGRLALIDPSTKKVAAIGGFTPTSAYHGGHWEGTTSAAVTRLRTSGLRVRLYASSGRAVP